MMPFPIIIIKLFTFQFMCMVRNVNCSNNSPYKFWLGPNYRGTHSTSRGLSSLLTAIEDSNEIMFKHSNDADAIFANFLERERESFHVLELGCGEGRALGQLVAKYSKLHDINFNSTCFNLKGYKKVRRGIPISGAVSSELPSEIRKMLNHYKIYIDESVNIPKVVLGDASKSPWPFPVDTFSLMLSQAALSKIDELDIVLDEALRTLKPGGFAALGLGGTHKCNNRISMLPAIQRQLFCAEILVSGQAAVVALSFTSPYDNLEESKKKVWFESYRESYSGSLKTTVLLSKSIPGIPNMLACPVSKQDGIVEFAIRSCEKFTPAWDRGVKKVVEYFNSKQAL